MATHIESGSGTNFIPQLWAGTILRTLENNLVGNKICTTDYTGEIKKAGDAVHFNGLNDPDVKEYSGSNIVYESLSDIRRLGWFLSRSTQLNTSRVHHSLKNLA